MPTIHLERRTIIFGVVSMAVLSIATYYFVTPKMNDKKTSIQVLEKSTSIETTMTGDSDGPIKYLSRDNYIGMNINNEYNFDLDNNGFTENFIIKSYEVVIDRKNGFTYYGPTTDVLVKRVDGYVKLLSQLDGYLLEAKEVTLKPGGEDAILLIELKQGKLDNFLLYRYINGTLERITTPDDIPPSSYGIFTRGVADFEDVDKDGSKEMVVYSRLFPPVKKREVNIYKINGLEAKRINTYEEDTPNVIY